ncbi:MAG: hypothetical protein HY908_14075 [Myxococcales bacterium]|nr:hypothetical protein [Myxococcales bacterium]
MTYRRAAVGVCLVATSLGVLACKSSGDAKSPDEAAKKPRDTEMVHQACDLESSGASVLDADRDGRPEIIRVTSGAREVCRAIDINGDGGIDFFNYFDAEGRLTRRESGFDRDNRPEQIAYYEGGQIVRRERETNFDGKLDTWDYYEGGRLVREERDATADGFVDQWWDFDRPAEPECARVRSDADADGQPDAEEPIDTCASDAFRPTASASTAASAAPAGAASVGSPPASAPAPSAPPAPPVTPGAPPMPPAPGTSPATAPSPR